MRTTLIATCAAAAAALSFGIAAHAADSTPPAKPAATSHDGKKPDDPNRMICKSQEVTGSAIPTHKVCRTKQEWDDLTEQSRQMMDQNHAYNPTKG